MVPYLRVMSDVTSSGFRRNASECTRSSGKRQERCCELEMKSSGASALHTLEKFPQTVFVNVKCPQLVSAKIASNDDVASEPAPANSRKKLVIGRAHPYQMTKDQELWLDMGSQSAKFNVRCVELTQVARPVVAPWTLFGFRLGRGVYFVNEHIRISCERNHPLVVSRVPRDYDGSRGGVKPIGKCLLPISMGDTNRRDPDTEAVIHNTGVNLANGDPIPVGRLVFKSLDSDPDVLSIGRDQVVRHCLKSEWTVRLQRFSSAHHP